MSNVSESGHHIGLPAPETSPAPHLFNITRELRDLIYEAVFSRKSDLTNSKALRPLLTCRRFYHEAHRIAWRNVTFDTSQSKFCTLSRAPQRSIAPKLHCVNVSWTHLSSLFDFHASVPRIERLRVAELERYEYVLCLAIVLRCTDIFMFVEQFEIPARLMPPAMSSEAERILRRSVNANPQWNGPPVVEEVGATSGVGRHYRFTMKTQNAPHMPNPVVVKFITYD